STCTPPAPPRWTRSARSARWSAACSGASAAAGSGSPRRSACAARVTAASAAASARLRALEPSDSAMIDRAPPLDSLATTLAALVRYRTLLRELVLKDLKLKYRGSVLEFLWSLVNPLVMIAVYSFAFRYILHNATQGFVFLVLIGILAWTFFSNAAMMSTGAIADSGSLLKSVFFPR